MLKEEVISTFIEEESIGIVDPMLSRREVKSGAELFSKYAVVFVRMHGAYLILSL